MNDKTRRGVLKRDDHQCQLDKMFGISQLSGVPCSIERLEVHHKTYERAEGNNELPEDLITVCVRCHDIITDAVRRLRHGRRNKNFKQTRQDKPKLKQGKRKAYDGDFEISSNGRSAHDPAQWQVSRSPRRVRAGDEGDYFEQKENRCRP